MTSLKTTETLLRALKRASARITSAEEIEKQRVSFVFGSLKPGNGVTRDQILAILKRQEGKQGKG